MITADQLKIQSLGERRIPSPLGLSSLKDDGVGDWVSDDARVLFDVDAMEGQPVDTSRRLEVAGPRDHMYFSPDKTRVGLVTCGGLCPGLNNVLRSIVLQLFHRYGIRDILGFRYGYEGLNPKVGAPPMTIGPFDVRHVHRLGGSMLGLGRGAQDVGVMVDSLVAQKIDILLALGGDGTLKGAHAIANEVRRRGLDIGIVGNPKTIDNDVPFVDKTFGFDTAVDVARMVLDAAHTEATGARNGVGLVKLMGRDSGFIAAHATLASGEVNFCLLPEVSFELDGPHGLLAALERRLTERGHALIVVAEGCGQTLAKAGAERDASGNIRYASEDADVGPRFRDITVKYFKERKIPVTLKYIDPSYTIRSVPANANDSVFCERLGRHAVHAAMAGKTDMIIGMSHGIFTHVPLAIVTQGRRQVDPDLDLWLAVTEITGQPRLVGPK
jgi:6-phosphofructokinase 1